MGFQASEAVEALEFDLGPYVEAKGTIPEPSREAVDACFARIRGAGKTAGLDDEGLAGSREEVLRTFAKAPEEALKKMGEEYTLAIIDLCQGSPTREEYEALPFRVQRAFSGWILGQFVDPLARNGSKP